MKRRTTAIFSVSSLLVAVSGTIIAVAGPLDPPAGPVASTYKTLGEVEPRILLSAATTPGDSTCVFKITQPGSYYLGGNVSIPAGRSGIVVAAPDVTIDLNGFRISGQGGSQDGVTTLTMPYSNVSLRNGTIVSVTGDGVSFFAVNGGTIQDVHVRLAGGRGIYAGDAMIVRDCSASQCTVSGFSVSVGAVLEGCTALNNTSHGFISEYGATLVNCSARGNGAAGFKVHQSTLVECNASGNAGNGFECGFRSQLRGCRAQYNTLVGIRAFDGVTIQDCMSNNNTRQGIHVDNNCFVSNNQVYSNGSGYAGIWLDGTGNRCQDNQSIGNAYGVFTGGSDNFVVRNTCRQSTHSNFHTLNPATNEVAPVVSSPGNNAFGTATPWSNFTY